MKNLGCYILLILGALILVWGCGRTRTLEEIAFEKQVLIIKEDVDYLKKNYGTIMPVFSELSLESQRKSTLEDVRPWLSCGLIDTADALNFVLPYMVNDAVDSNWRWQVKERFTHTEFPKGKVSMDGFMRFCNQVGDSIKKEMTFGSIPGDESQLSYAELQRIGMGSCVAMSDYAKYTFRALGIPVTNDFIPVWGNLNATGHVWNSLLIKGKSVPFMGAESNIGDYNPLVLSTRDDGSISTKRLPPKVYRSARYSEGNFEFFGKKVLDVTDEYVTVNTIDIEVTEKTEAPIYLSTYNRGVYIVAAIGDKQGNRTTFTKMGTGLVYFPVKLERAAPVPVAYPIICRQHKNETKKPDLNKLQNIEIDHLLPLAQGQMDYLAKYGYIGLEKIDFHNKYDVSPRPSDNGTYELYYWDMRWIKHSSEMPEAKRLVFHNAPVNSIYLVKSVAGSFDRARPFTFQNGTIEWF